MEQVALAHAQYGAITQPSLIYIRKARRRGGLSQCCVWDGQICGTDSQRGRLGPSMNRIPIGRS